jgi:hypothetical protein
MNDTLDAATEWLEQLSPTMLTDHDEALAEVLCWVAVIND